MERDTEKELKRLARFAWLLDNAIPIPGSSVRVGLDPLIGLFPAFGDLLGAALSTYFLAAAARLGTPKSVLVKMAFNVWIDTVVGAIPLVGDLFDFAWKSNMRNLRLLEAYLENPRGTVMASRLFVWFLGLLMVGFALFIGFLVYLVVRALWHAAAGTW